MHAPTLPRPWAGACLLLAASFFVSPAQAQDASGNGAASEVQGTTARPAAAFRRLSPTPLTRLPEWHLVQARTDGMRDAGRASPQPQLAPVHALRAFKLQFQNGDHKLRRVGVFAEDRFVTFALADGNGDDPFLAHAEFVNLADGAMAEVAGIGGGKFEIPLPAGPSGHVPVLAGFEFRRTDGTDANLRNIGVWLDTTRGVVRVSLIDDQGLDLRQFQETIGATIAGALLPGVMDWAGPVAGIVGPSILGGAIGGKVIRQQYGNQRGYQVRVRYAWIPRVAVKSSGALAGTERDMAMPSDWQRAPRVDLLQGFEFTFMNSDHHLLGIAVNDLWQSAPAPRPAPVPAATSTNPSTTNAAANAIASARAQADAAAAQRAAPPNAKGVMFQDNNRDDPVQWSYTYVTLHGDPRP